MRETEREREQRWARIWALAPRDYLLAHLARFTVPARRSRGSSSAPAGRSPALEAEGQRLVLPARELVGCTYSTTGRCSFEGRRYWPIVAGRSRARAVLERLAHLVVRFAQAHHDAALRFDAATGELTRRAARASGR